MKFSKRIFFTCLPALVFFSMSKSLAQSKRESSTSATLRIVQKKYRLDPNQPLPFRITPTPDDILQKFRDAGMSPTAHPLSSKEKKIIAEAFAVLPPLHQRVLKQHLQSISFLDNMPNTALTAPVTNNEGVNLYHIAFRAGILNQTISEWATEKERTCFTRNVSTIQISIEAGLLNAFTYILLHEGTHVVDGSLQLIASDSVAGIARLNAFTTRFSKGVWKDITTHDWPVKDSIILKNRFRPGGSPFSPHQAPEVYQSLAQSPFVSLYSTASWHEDLAELLTIYHLTQRLQQPFRILITKNGTEFFSYEPTKSSPVQYRFDQLKYFYTKD